MASGISGWDRTPSGLEDERELTRWVEFILLPERGSSGRDRNKSLQFRCQCGLSLVKGSWRWNNHFSRLQTQEGKILVGFFNNHKQEAPYSTGSTNKFIWMVNSRQYRRGVQNCPSKGCPKETRGWQHKFGPLVTKYSVSFLKMKSMTAFERKK